MAAAICQQRRPGADAPPGWRSGSGAALVLVGGDVAADREGLDDRGELRERVADERPVDFDQLEGQPGGVAVGEEAVEDAVSLLEPDRQAELIS